MFTQLNQYHVVLEVKSGFDRNPADLNNLFIRTGVTGSSVPASESAAAFPNGGQIPLNTFSHVETTTVPITINHLGSVSRSYSVF